MMNFNTNNTTNNTTTNTTTTTTSAAKAARAAKKAAQQEAAMRSEKVRNVLKRKISAEDTAEFREYLKELNKKIDESGRKAIYVEVPIKYLDIPNYQRTALEEKVNKIVRFYDELCIQVKRANIRDGRIWVVDGQQTIEALLAIGETYPERKQDWVPMMVSNTLTYEQESILFMNQYNCVTRVSHNDRFRAGVEGKVVWALEIKEVIDNYHLTTERKITPIKNNISATSTLMSIYTSINKETNEPCGKDGVEITLRVIKDAGYDEYSNGFSKNMLSIGAVLAKYNVKIGDAKYKKVVDLMKTLGNPDIFASTATAKYPSSSTGKGEGAVRCWIRNMIHE